MPIGGAVSGLLLLTLLLPNLLLAEQPATYASAQQAFAQKNYLDAARLFSKVASEEAALPPLSRSDALLMEARCFFRAGKSAQAEPPLRAYLAENSRSAPALYLLGVVLQSENKPGDSLHAFTQAAALSTPRAEDLRLVALDYVLLNDYADAVRWLKRAVADDTANAEAWYDLGRANMHQGDFIESEHDFQRVLSINPNEPRALNNLGLSYEAQNRTGEALAAYTHAVEAQKSSLHASEQPLLNLGALLNTKSRFDEAVAALQQAVAMGPDCSRCHEELSRAFAGKGQSPEAIKEMERAVALDANNAALHYQLARLYRRAGMADRAQQELKVSADLYGSRSSTLGEGRSASQKADDGKP
ncbi:MAG TPA: tetratricopeptide repeat protein [Acidisarcina sp.]